MHLKSVAPLLLIVVALRTSLSLPIVACNCSSPNNLGLLDLEESTLCGPEEVEQPVEVSYRLFTKDKPKLAFDGHICTMWIKIKQIDGYFFGSYDTTFHTISQEVPAELCWKWKQTQMCFDNAMHFNGNTWEFSRNPVGEGIWMTSRQYKVVNCRIKTIKLEQECINCPIKSPYGIVTNISTVNHVISNLVTIVWEPRKIAAFTECKLVSIHHGKGNVMSDSNKSISRLVDKKDQLEFHYDVDEVSVCGTRNLHKIEGIPDSYVSIQKNNQPLRDLKHFKVNGNHLN